MKTTPTIADDAATALEQDRKNREKTIRELAVRLSHEEAAELCESVGYSIRFMKETESKAGCQYP